jgi:hypothetical protein
MGPAGAGALEPDAVQQAVRAMAARGLAQIAPLDRALTGHLEPGGRFACYAFDYAADGSTVTVNLQVPPDDPSVLRNVGFRVYAPNGQLIGGGGVQPGLTPNISGDVRTSDRAARGRATVQVYDYDPVTPIDYRIWLAGGAILWPASGAAPAGAASPAAGASPVAPSCAFRLGFARLASLLGDVVGSCTEDEHTDPVTGDSLQRTTTGLLVWRREDNVTAFTDGYRTWLNGPLGLQERLNSEHFDWESAPAPGAPPVPEPVVQFSIDGGAIVAGRCVAARWSVANASAVYQLGAGIDAVALPLSGERSVCPSEPRLTLSVVDLAGERTSHTIAAPAPPGMAPSMRFWADRTAVAAGECTTLRWDVERVRAIYLRTPDGREGIVGRGERGVCPGLTTTYGLDVVDLAGATTTQTITIGVAGQGAQPVSFWAERSAIAPGQCTRLHWRVASYQSVHLSAPEGFLPVAGQGEHVTGPGSTTIYTLAVLGVEGQTTFHSLTVRVGA